MSWLLWTVLQWVLGCMYLLQLVFSGSVPSSGVAGSYGNSSVLMNLHTILHRGCTSFCPHQLQEGSLLFHTPRAVSLPCHMRRGATSSWWGRDRPRHCQHWQGPMLRRPGAGHCLGGRPPAQSPLDPSSVWVPSGLSCLIWTKRSMHLWQLNKLQSAWVGECEDRGVWRKAWPRPSRGPLWDLAWFPSWRGGPGECPCLLAWGAALPRLQSLGLQGLSPPSFLPSGLPWQEEQRQTVGTSESRTGHPCKGEPAGVTDVCKR